MVGVGGPYRHYHHARPYIELRYEGFLQPELLEGNFAPTLYLRLVFASFLVLEFHGAFGASVLEFYFRTERPPFAEVVTKKNHRVGNVEPPVAAGVAVCIGCDVAQIAVAVEVAAEGYFAVAAYVDAAEPRGPVGCFLFGGGGFLAVCQCDRRCKHYCGDSGRQCDGSGHVFSVAVVVLKFRCKVMAIIFRPQSLKFGNFNYCRCSYPAPEILTFNYWHRRPGVVSERQAGAQCELEPVRRPQIAVGDGAEEIDVACTQFIVYRQSSRFPSAHCFRRSGQMPFQTLPQR